MTGRLLGMRHRYVTELDGTVRKLGCPLDVLTGSQNLTEQDTWFRVRNTNLRAFYAPVLAAAADGSWLVMPFVERIIVPSQRILREFERELTDHGISMYDLTNENVGYYGGRLVMLDYGHTRLAQAMFESAGRQFCGACHYCEQTYRTEDERGY